MQDASNSIKFIGTPLWRAVRIFGTMLGHEQVCTKSVALGGSHFRTEPIKYFR